MNRVTQQPKLYTDKRAFVVLSTITLALFTLYVYFISASIVHVVLRTEVSQDITHLSSEISSLESKYIAAQYKVSNDVATLQGYQKAPNKVFITRAAENLAFRP